MNVPSQNLSNTETKTGIPLARLATPVNSAPIQASADKMGRPPAKPNMAREATQGVERNYQGQ